MIISYVAAVASLSPTTEFTCVGDTYEYANIVWSSGAALPSKAQLDTHLVTMYQMSMWEKIKEERDRRKAGGVLVAGNWFHTDDTSRIQQLGLAMMGANVPVGIMWKTMTGTFVEMTQALAGQIFNAVATSDITIFQTAEQKKTEMTASPTPETYDPYVGWPLSFGE